MNYFKDNSLSQILWSYNWEIVIERDEDYKEINFWRYKTSIDSRSKLFELNDWTYQLSSWVLYKWDREIEKKYWSLNSSVKLKHNQII